MGKRKLLTGVIVGAVVGGLTALVNKEARTYTKNKVKEKTKQTKYYLKNPSIAVRNVRKSVEKFNEKLEEGSTSTLQALEQIEETLDKIVPKDE